jgi:hypothetical protein
VVNSSTAEKIQNYFVTEDAARAGALTVLP